MIINQKLNIKSHLVSSQISTISSYIIFLGILGKFLYYIISLTLTYFSGTYGTSLFFFHKPVKRFFHGIRIIASAHIYSYLLPSHSVDKPKGNNAPHSAVVYAIHLFHCKCIKSKRNIGNKFHSSFILHYITGHI